MGVPKRNHYAEQLAEVRKQLAYSVPELDSLQVRWLTPVERAIYRYALVARQLTTSDLIAMRAWKENYASTVLKRLYDLGLLNRVEELREFGREFVYTPKNLGDELLDINDK